MLPKFTTPTKSARPMSQTRRTKTICRQRSARESAIHTLDLLLRLREEGLPGASPQAIGNLQTLLYYACQDASAAQDGEPIGWGVPAEKRLNSIQEPWRLIKEQTPCAMHSTVDRLLVGANNALSANDPNAFGAIISRLSHIVSGPSGLIPNKNKVWNWTNLPSIEAYPQADPSSYLPPCQGLEHKFLDSMEDYTKDLPQHEAEELMSHVAGFLDPLPKEVESVVHHRAMNFLLVKEKILRPENLPSNVIDLIGKFAVNSTAVPVAPTRAPERAAPPKKTAASSFKDKVGGHSNSLNQPAIEISFSNGTHGKFEKFLQDIGEYRKTGNHSKADEKRLRQAQKDLQKSLSNKNYSAYRATMEAFHKALPDGTDMPDGNVESKKTGGRRESRLSKISKAASNLLSPRGKKK
jgi:hypothetical protein